MAYDTVRTAVDGHVGTITLDRPEAMNTFSTGLAGDLDDALRAFDREETVRAIVVDGAGDGFSAGIDLNEFEAIDSEAAYERWVARMESPFLTVTEIGTPVIAAAHGFAAANGIGLIAASDLAVLAEGTRLGATAPKVGLFCMGPAVPLMGSLTEKRALELLLTGDLIDAETALEWGLVNRVVPEADLHHTATELAESIAANAPVAVQRGKAAYYAMRDLDYEAALEYSNAEFAALCTTDDATEGVAAFFEKRDPAWAGR